MTRKSASRSGPAPLGAEVIFFPRRDAHAVRALSRRLPQLTDAEREAKARAFCDSRWPDGDDRPPEAA